MGIWGIVSLRFVFVFCCFAVLRPLIMSFVDLLASGGGLCWE